MSLENIREHLGTTGDAELRREIGEAAADGCWTRIGSCIC